MVVSTAAATLAASVVVGSAAHSVDVGSAAATEVDETGQSSSSSWMGAADEAALVATAAAAEDEASADGMHCEGRDQSDSLARRGWQQVSHSEPTADDSAFRAAQPRAT